MRQRPHTVPVHPKMAHWAQNGVCTDHHLSACDWCKWPTHRYLVNTYVQCTNTLTSCSYVDALWTQLWWAWLYPVSLKAYTSQQYSVYWPYEAVVRTAIALYIRNITIGKVYVGLVPEMGRRGNILISDYPSLKLPRDGFYHFIHEKLLEYGSRPELESSCCTWLLDHSSCVPIDWHRFFLFPVVLSTILLIWIYALTRLSVIVLTFQVDPTANELLTYADLLTQVERVSYHLQQEGVKAGDVFAICARNGVKFVVLKLALDRIGAIFALINSTLTKGAFNFYQSFVLFSS